MLRYIPTRTSTNIGDTCKIWIASNSDYIVNSSLFLWKDRKSYWDDWICLFMSVKQKFTICVSVVQKGKRCQRTVRPQDPIRITFAGCSTAQQYRPRTCGTCTDGRCCTPSLSRTVSLHFHCSDGEGFYRNVMWIQRCSCSTSCHSDSRPSSPSVSLHNDIHTFRHWGRLVLPGSDPASWVNTLHLPTPTASHSDRGVTCVASNQVTHLLAL